MQIRARLRIAEAKQVCIITEVLAAGVTRLLIAPETFKNSLVQTRKFVLSQSQPKSCQQSTNTQNPTISIPHLHNHLIDEPQKFDN